MTTNLCFHGIGVCAQEREPGEARYWVTQEVFTGILDLVQDRSDVSISFDDGNRSDVDIALPALVERGMSATFFALAGRLDDPASLTPADLRALSDSGMSVGTHGWSHIPWRGLSDREVQRELVDARRVLAEACGTEIVQVALPLGRYDRRLLAHLRDARYETVFTSDRFRARPGSWLQARYSATSDDTVESISALLHTAVSMSDVRNTAASILKRLR